MSRAPPIAPTADALLAEARAALASADVDGALARLERIAAARLETRHAEALFDLGNAFADRGDARAAARAFEAALRLVPGHPGVLINLGVQLDNAGELARAERCYREVLQRRPREVPALANLAALLFRQKRFAQALEVYERLLAEAPHAPAEIWNNRGVCQRHVRDHAGAMLSFRRALELAPESPQILGNLGLLECEQRNYEDARPLLERSHALDSSRVQIAGQLLDLDLQFADWRDFERQRDALIENVAALGDHPGQAVSPFAFMSICDSPDLQLAAARSFAWPEDADLRSAAPPFDVAAAPRLRLGFVSTAFHEHPVPRLIVDVLERIDRNRFDVYAYALGSGAADAMRARIASLATQFRETQGMTTPAIVDRIRADRISVLFDLAGQTDFARPELFAGRAAPLQINYLGYAGTLGAPYYDYIVTDTYATPPAEQACFDERFWYVGECYLPCDPLRPMAHPPTSREEYGLPGDAFVFVSQAAPYKILPSMFGVWMRLLQQTPGSVLWLRPMRALTEANLRAEARARDVDPARLLFAPGEPLPRYLARYRLADVYLDTHPFGSHTSVNDALYVGLPVVTLAGRSMASRASASQLRAVGLSELIAGSPSEYEAIALALSRDAERLGSLKARLSGEARASPLFDMADYTRRFEEGLLRIWAQRGT